MVRRLGTYGDWFIMLIAGGLLLFWLYRAFYRWLHEPANVNRIKLGKGGAVSSNDENVKLLRKRGYEVTSGKHVIRIPIEMDDSPLGSGTRLYIDYIAEKDDSAYLVKTARERMPMDWTASGVRDRLLVYALLLPDCSGVLFVDAKEGIVRKIVFHLID
ncbi:hypothetical protein [Paenibacillus sp. HB172176]|uniref:hypothetical protein n=1 Tax=Paenibacillus sp. HB172176 TaxID=2493690 RepID=UPI001F0DF732|nr:hypothetical protein [Paenibacillus sp. HB172176]